MNERYRIYTEDLPNVAALAAGVFESFTIIKTQGYWKGQSEASVIIEVLGDGTDYDKVLDLAATIRVVNGQQAVLVTFDSTVGRMIYDQTAHSMPAIPTSSGDSPF